MDAAEACVKPTIPLAEPGGLPGLFVLGKTRNAASARTAFLRWRFSFLTLSLPSQQFIFHFCFFFKAVLESKIPTVEGHSKGKKCFTLTHSQMA